MSIKLDELRQLEMKCLALAAAAMDHVAEIGILIEAEIQREYGIDAALTAIAETIEPTFEENWEHDQQKLDEQHRLDNPILALRTEEPS